MLLKCQILRKGSARNMTPVLEYVHVHTRVCVCVYIGKNVQGASFETKRKEEKRRELSNCRSKTIQLSTKIDQKLERNKGGRV